jgi:ComF family protein
MSGPDWQIDSIRAPFVYGPPLARYLWALKYRAKRHLGRAIGQLLGEAIETADTVDMADAGIDAVVAVPLHPRRLRTRSFNQADEIAGPIAARLGRPLLASGIRRTIETRPQTELDRKARLQAPMGSFAVCRNLTGLKIAIVDDVITTGATINAFAEALKSKGAASVEAWSVARTVGPARKAIYSTRKI